MLKASGAMAAATLLSRVLGMVRVMAYAWFMGDSWVAGAFTFAFQIPNLFRRLLGEGALTAAFIPIFKEKEKTHGEIEMWRAANAVISGLIIAAAVISTGRMRVRPARIAASNALIPACCCSRACAKRGGRKPPPHQWRSRCGQGESRCRGAGRDGKGRSEH